MPRSFKSEQNREAPYGKFRTSLMSKRRSRIPVRNLYDLPVNCRFRLNKLFIRNPGHHAHVSLMRLFNFAIWPKRLTRWTVDSINNVTPLTLPSARYVGQFFSAKLGRAVRYESLAKRQFFRRLEKAHSVLWYVERPVSIAYCQDGRAFLHVPDALVWLRDERIVMCEIKAPAEMRAEMQSPRWQTLSDYCDEAGWGLLLTDGEFSAKELDRHGFNDSTVYSRTEQALRGNSGNPNDDEAVDQDWNRWNQLNNSKINRAAFEFHNKHKPSLD